MYEKQTLPNGVRILTEAIPGVRTAALGIFVGVGSRVEKAAENGTAHFIEHMTFKGTARRTAAQLAQEMDAIGGQVNAYTTKESTCFYARCLDCHLDQAADILCDMFFESKFAQEDVVTERGVIFEEIDMYEDTPEDLCSERLAAAVYRGSSLARPILGKPSTLEKMDGEFLRAFRDSHYAPGSIVVALAGSFTPAQADELKARFSALAPRKTVGYRPAHYTPSWTVKRKAIEQNHLTLAFPALNWRDPRRYQMQVLVNILGGGMSSRLFQEVREKRGLCYTTYAYNADHADIGVLGIYTALGRETEREALQTIRRVAEELVQHGPEEAELSRTREQCKANVLMGLESVQARMSQMGRSELLLGAVQTPDEIIAGYDAVTRQQVHTMAQELLDFDKVSLSAVGRVSPADEYQTWINT